MFANLTPKQAIIILGLIRPHLIAFIGLWNDIPSQVDPTPDALEDMTCEELRNGTIDYNILIERRPDCFESTEEAPSTDYIAEICRLKQINIENGMSEEEALIEAIQAVDANPIYPFTIVYLGGSYDEVTGTQMLGPDPIEQAPVWGEMASTELQVRYPGVPTNPDYDTYVDPGEVASIEGVPEITEYRGKWGQAERAIDILAEQDLLNTDILVIGYSAGADAAPMLASQYLELKGAGLATGNIVGVVMLGPHISGTFGSDPNVNSGFDQLWESVLDELLANGIDIYIFDDSVDPAVDLSTYRPPEDAEGSFVHNESDTEHYLVAESDLPEGTATNRSQNIRYEILSWWFNNHADDCN